MIDLMLPFVAVSARNVAVLATRLDEALATLKHLGQRAGPGNRLQLAAKELRRIESAGAFPQDAKARVRAANAVRLGFRATHIIGALVEGIPEGLRPIIPRFLSGSLEDVGSTEAFQAESELTWGVIAAAGGLRPRVPTAQPGKSPDFVVHAKGLDIALEVKRPASAEYLFELIKGAVLQCTEFGCPYNAVILDLSDVLTPHSGTVNLSDAQAKALQPRFQAFATEASDIVAQNRLKPPFNTILYLGLAADAFAWRVDKEGGSYPATSFFAYQQVFPEAVSGLVVEQMYDLRSRLESGLQSLGARTTAKWRA